MHDFSEVVFDSAHSLDGAMLVEASAGTGKTYSIQNAYLRLVVAYGLKVQEILVVTFTEAATAELRQRLRTVLVKCRRYLEDGPDPDDPDCTRVARALALAFEGSPPPEGGARTAVQLARVRLALMDFDSAAISTIHGFCQRVLDRYAFECGYDAEARLVDDPARLVDDVCRDWWRQAHYGTEAAAARMVFKNPAELARAVCAALGRPDALIAPVQTDAEEGPDITARLQAVRAAWRTEIADGCGNNDAGRTLLEAMRTLSAPANALPDLRDLRFALDNAISAVGTATITPVFPCWLAAKVAAAQAGGAQGTVTAAQAGDTPGTAEIDEWLEGRWLLPKKTRRAQDIRAAVMAVAGDEAPLRSRALCTLAAAVPKDLFDPKVDGLAPALPAALRALQRQMLTLMAAVIRDLRQVVCAHILESSALTYDAMLTQVRDALHGPQGERLTAALRGDFRAALVDEFQDTDPVQYDIFNTVFGQRAPAGPLLYVGDPKQAIYGFRNGDIFTYYAARQQVRDDRHHDLARNYRSEAALVSAVNALFRDDSGGDGTFMNANIHYAPLAAADTPAEHTLYVDGRTDSAPLRIWRYATETRRMPGKDSALALAMYDDIADEMARLLDNTGVRIGGATGRRLDPGDMAVLVMTHDEAELVEQALVRRRIHVERQSTGNVFDSEAAADLVSVVQAMVDPRHAAHVRAALCTRFFPCTERDVRHYASFDAVGGDAGVTAFGDWMELFCEAEARWRDGSFFAAFRHLADRVQLRALLCGRAEGDGERWWTDLEHLVSLAHRQSCVMQLSAAGLLRWLVQQMHPETRDDDRENFERRPSGDDRAVKVMTVFRSKGLEFPVVFVPTLWRRQASPGRDPWLAYHDARGNMILNFDKRDPDGQVAVQAEALQENVRLAYVALTRAVNRVYLTAVDRPGGEPGDYALERLLDRLYAAPPAEGIQIEQGPRCPATSTRRTRPSAPTADLRTWDERAGIPLAVNRRHGHASFSSLAPHTSLQAPPVLQDLDADSGGAEPRIGERPAEGIFAIAAGARTGDCWHAIFERIDFQAEPAAIDTVTDEELDRHRICRGPTVAAVAQQRQAVREMVHRVLVAETGAGFALQEVGRHDRRSELQFHFTLCQHGPVQTTQGLRAVLDRHWHGPVRDDEFLRRLGSVRRELPLGFMTGYMDLVFQHHGRFYIVDWKSNRLGGDPASFDREGMAAEMARQAYYLQYMIYTVALDGFLRRRIRDYDYEMHFGGVFYVFLRGVDPAVPGQGFFHDRPSGELVARLGRMLAAGDAP